MSRKVGVLIVVVSQALMGVAHATMPVIDIGAISRLVAQLHTAEQQLATTRDALTEARNAYTAMTGNRGLEQLLSGANRNYLPSNWAEVSAALSQAQGAYGALSSQLSALVQANAVLSAEQLARFTPNDRDLHEAHRREVALLQALTRQALSATSQRFASLDQLIQAIGATRDPKSIAELTARIGAEQAMLANDASKLATLYQSAQAQQAATRLPLVRACAGGCRLTSTVAADGA
ncbi:MAG: type IV secretion system protein [Gammaproteobacteria bacterium]